MSTTESQTKIVILGAGKGGTSLLESFLNLPGIALVGIADTNPHARGLQVARFHHIPITNDPLSLIRRNDIHLIVDVTGDPSIPILITQHKQPGSEVLGGAASKVLWDLIQHESMIQAQLFQAEKLAGMGTFASGIAHDINNPLYVILAMAEAIQEESDLSTIHQHSKSIQEAALRIQGISRDITQYARASKTLDSVNVDIQAKLDEALTIARYATTIHELTVEKHYQDNGDISAKPEELLQVLVNLMTNAIHAMDGKGCLTLSTKRQNGNIQIGISDTGCGIPSENLEKIFDPFFTTKPNGKGTGLGLYNVRTLVRKYQGELTIESDVGKGTTFCLVFPNALST